MVLLCIPRQKGPQIKTQGETKMTRLLQTYAAPAGRVLLALIFIVAGFQKLTGYAGT